jgi:hypothetical protein
MLMAVGFVAWASAQVDDVLRALFCGLEGSKYAAVTAGGQNTDWLKQACEALAKHRDDVSPQHEDELKKHLRAIKDQMSARHRYIHSVWHFDDYANNAAYFSLSRRHNYFHAAHIANTDQVLKRDARCLSSGKT